MSSSWLPRSKGPPIAVGLMLVASSSAVAYSHYQQKRDKAVMRAGVERDKERLRRLRQERGG